MGVLEGESAIVLGESGPGKMGQDTAQRFLEHGAQAAIAGWGR